MVMRDEKLAVIVASAQRAQTLHETLLSLLRQRRLPGQILVAVPDDGHVDSATRRMPNVAVIHSAVGSTRQRNAGIDALAPAVELVTFFDDDVEIHEDYLENVVGAFDSWPEAVLADGRVLVDGKDIPRVRAQEIIAASGHAPHTVTAIGPEVAYGCNMTVRRSALATARFDERLPLYGYMEDRDFAFQCARLGRIIRCESATLVHLRPHGGRGSPRRFGFSQVMNPIYLWSKGSFASRRGVFLQVSRPLVVNSVLSLVPGQSGRRRRQQFAGNCRALSRALRGRIAPEDMLGL
jgi:GT2 family glycosyltransferase